MPASGIKLLDANVWLALAYSDHVHHAVATRWFDTQPESSCGFCRLTQLALLRHLTNAKIMGKYVQSQQQAWAAYDSFASDPRVAFIPEVPSLESEFRALTQSPSPSHGRWSDAYLTAFAILNSAQLVTFDRGFSAFNRLNYLLLPGT